MQRHVYTFETTEPVYLRQPSRQATGPLCILKLVQNYGECITVLATHPKIDAPPSSTDHGKPKTLELRHFQPSPPKYAR